MSWSMSVKQIGDFTKQQPRPKTNQSADFQKFFVLSNHSNLRPILKFSSYFMKETRKFNLAKPFEILKELHKQKFLKKILKL